MAISFVLLLLISSTDLVIGQSSEFLTCAEECESTNNNYCNDCCTFDFSALTYLEIDGYCGNPGTGRIRYNNSSSSDPKYALEWPDRCLTVVPENVCDFPTIHYINFDNNNISEIPNLSCLKQLVYLKLRFNQIQVLKRGIFGSLDKLRVIYLSGNKIHTIETGVFHTGLNSIKFVHLDYNRLTESDLWVLNITHEFCYFDVMHNEISRVTNKANFKMDFDKNYGPGFYDLRYNKFELFDTAPLETIGHPFLRVLSKLFPWGFDLRNNPWHCDCRMHPLLSIIDNLRERIPRDYLDVTCASPAHLTGMIATSIDLSDFVCNVTESCPPGCLCQKQPQANRMVIDCQYAGLSKMPEHLPFHENLFLNFQNNFIDNLTALPYMERTVQLDLSHNNLTNIQPEVFASSVDKLQYLNLANNRLKYLPKTIQNLLSTEIDLSNNMLICSCDSLWLNSWFESKPYIKNRPNITCSTANGDQRITIDNLQPGVFNCRGSNSVTIIIVLVILSFLVIVLIIGIIYFRFEIMASYHIYILPKIKSKWTQDIHEDEQKQHDIFVLVNDEHAPDRLWVKDNLIPYLDLNFIKSYISFRDGIIGEVTSDANITNMHNSRTVLAVISKSLFEEPLRVFELNEAYCHKLKQGKGNLVLIKREECGPSSKKGHISAMLRLKQFIDASDVRMKEKLERNIR
ncbi:protein toll [Patella vulgata]|uniref:protein toll n=1 Tax=Patella vulgata TaxID=6465 RepID=UPI0024A8B5A3|nr:protein toll [Patella vulgata]XP_050400691.2 protein toll [Patella vulgata]